MEGIVSEPPEQGTPEWRTMSELRAIGEALQRLSRLLHDHARRLEAAVEGTYAGDSGDPRVRLLGESLRVSRTADLELGRLTQAGQRVLATLQEQLAQIRETQEYLRRVSMQLPPVVQPPLSPASTPPGGINGSTEALNTSINN
jgi:hypothetical protein